MKSKVIKDGVVVAVILLFFGVAVAPGINGITNQERLEDEYVEYTTEFCGLPGLQSQTVRFTKQQADEIEHLFNSIKTRLNNISSREEAVVIFKQAVVELYHYKLLPKEMSITQAQTFIMGTEPSEKHQELKKRILNRSQKENPNNTLCLLAGNVDRANFWSLTTVTSLAAGAFLIFLFFFLQSTFGWNSYTMFALATFVAMSFFVYGLFVKPLNLISNIDFTPSAKGSIFSIGLSGVYNIKGEFEGNIIGFTGIRIMKLVHGNPPSVYISPGAFFLGSAISMSLEPHG